MKQFIIPYLVFENSLEVANYYKEIFTGEIFSVMKGSDVPNVQESEKEKVMHLELKINNHFIYMSDGLDKPSNQITLHLDFSNLKKLKKAYDKMKVSGKVVQPLRDTFWGAIFGVLQDKYGVSWNFHYSKPQSK